jgi:phosphate uptake regulator
MPAAVERKALSEELNSLAENMQTIATLSVQAIERAVAGLDAPDTGVVGDVRALDREVYGLKERIVRSCVETIALHAPVAKDLRTITVALEVTTDLDRIGRYATDIAEAAHELHREGDGRESLPKLREMGNLTVGMIRTAVNSYLARDAGPVAHIHADHAEDRGRMHPDQPVPRAPQRPRRQRGGVDRLPRHRRAPNPAPAAAGGTGRSADPRLGRPTPTPEG